MRVLKLTLAYDGTNYAGWQRQLNGPSVQAVLEDAFVPLVGARPAVAGAGRTDAGVHALGQVASVQVSFAHDVVDVQRALNGRLPRDVRVVDVVDAPPTFHARFDAKGKAYRYRIATTAAVSPFVRWFVWHQPYRFDVSAMRAAAASFIGEHDFAAFQAAGSPIGDTTRTLTRLDITDADGEVVIDVEGDGFLRHMVRVIAGTLVDVSAGRRDASSMPALLASRDRQQAGDTAPAKGLTLMRVTY